MAPTYKNKKRPPMNKRKLPSYATTAMKRNTYKQPQFGSLIQRLPAYISTNVNKAEIKSVDIPATTSFFRAAALPPVAILLNTVVLGPAVYQRIGQKWNMKNYHLRGNIINALTTAEMSIRMLIVYDRQTNGVLPTFADVLQSVSSAGTATNTFFSEINLENRERFIILRDRMWHAPSVTFTAGVQTNGPQYPGQDGEWDVNEFIKMKGLGVCNKNAGTGAIGDIATGGLFMFLFNSPSGTDAAYAINWQSRMRYFDN